MESFTGRTGHVDIGSCHRCGHHMTFTKDTHPTSFWTFVHENKHACHCCGQQFEFIYQIGRVPIFDPSALPKAIH